VHWTYDDSAWDRDSDLEQGDFLVPTKELRDVLEGVHRHFCADKYLGFIVTTQSCDLVRRGATSTARYVNIATVRTLKHVVGKLLATKLRTVANGVFRNGDKLQAKQFLDKVFHQNEQALGLFYLHPDADIGLGDPAVAYLRVAIALRAEHYRTLVGARRARLKPEFRAKLGWLVGNLYSRAATPDWSDFEGGTRAVDRLVNEYVEEQITGAGPFWVDDDSIEAAQRAGADLRSMDREALIACLDEHKPAPRREVVADVVRDELAKLVTGLRIAAQRAAEKAAAERAGADPEAGGTTSGEEYARAEDSDPRVVIDEKFLHKFRNRLLNSGRLKSLLGS
jgi:hypothetical protein